MKLKLVSENMSFGGTQKVISHASKVCNCEMTFGLFMPEESLNTKIPLIWFLSGLTCTHENAMTKAGAQQWANSQGIAVVFPDTSPRGRDVADDPSFDLGQGAGFYLDAIVMPWAKNFNMESYILEELPELLFSEFNLDTSKQGIMGHSMGGLGAINFALKNPNRFKSVSAFSPIANPVQTEWGQKQFSAYLGLDKDLWNNYDPSKLIETLGTDCKFLIDQGTNDDFIKLLKPESLAAYFENNPTVGQFRYQSGYDHSYFFVSTFIKDHILHHADQFFSI